MRKRFDNIFLLEYNGENREMVPSKYEDLILTRYFEMGFDDNDMATKDVDGFLRTFQVPEVYIAKAVYDDWLIDGLENEKVIDFDKLVFATCKLLILAHNYDYIEDFWKVLIGKRKQQGVVVDETLLIPELSKIVEDLKLEKKIDLGLIIDMMATASTKGNVYLDFYDFLVLMGKLGEFEEELEDQENTDY